MTTILVFNDRSPPHPECLSQRQVREKDVCLKDITDLSTDSLAHLVAVKSDGAIAQLSVASKTVEKGSLTRSYAHTYIHT